MAVSSVSDISTAISTGKVWQSFWYKSQFAQSNHACWVDLSASAGIPNATTWPGVALACQNVGAASGIGLWHPTVTPDVKHLLSLTAVPSGTQLAAPGILVLLDVQCYWPGISANTASLQTLTGTPTLRYANGEGCRLYLTNSASLGTGNANVSISYTNQAGTTGRALPVTVALENSNSGGSYSAGFGSPIVHTNTNASFSTNKYGPFLPLASGDRGVQQVASITLSAGTGAGTLVLVLARPLAVLPIGLISVASYSDYFSMVPGMPVIKDDACLTLIGKFSTQGGSPISGSVSMVWG